MGIRSVAIDWRGRGDLLLATMAGSTYALVLLGIYTAAIGAGLTCEGRWPLCDGAVFGLFPASWPSFVEWFHRLAAMITGFLILGSWVVIWRRRTSRRAIAAMSLAILLLPFQIWLGAETVLGYEILTLTAHFLTALIIFIGVILAVTWQWGLDRSVPGAVGPLLATALALLIPFLLLTPHFLVIHRGAVQVLYYGVGFAMVVSLLLVAVGATRRGVRILASCALGLVAIQLVAGRLVRSPMIEALDWGAGVVTLLVVALALWIVRQGSGGSPFGHRPTTP